MKIRLSELRRIIRAVLQEQSTVPGKWDPRSGEPVSDEEIGTMDQAGLGLPADKEKKKDRPK